MVVYMQTPGMYPRRPPGGRPKAKGLATGGRLFWSLRRCRKRGQGEEHRQSESSIRFVVNTLARPTVERDEARVRRRNFTVYFG
jgi:hypothetical protein